MKLEKASRRDRKYQRRNKHVTDSRSVFQIEEEQKKRAIRIKKQRELKEEIKDYNVRQLRKPSVLPE